MSESQPVQIPVKRTQTSPLMGKVSVTVRRAYGMGDMVVAILGSLPHGSNRHHADIVRV